MNYLITEKVLVLSLNQSSDIVIDLKKMRLACPCAHCCGEKDVFGNTYSLKIKRSFLKNSFKIKTIKPVGNYGIKIFWKDGHSNGIYTFDLLKKISE